MKSWWNALPLSRRDFLLRTAKAGAVIASAVSLGGILHDPLGPVPGGSSGESWVLPDFSIPGGSPAMAVAQGSNRAETVRLALKSLGGMEKFIQKGDRVLIKVNAAFASPPMLSATTHPELLGEVIRMCLEVGAAEVTVTDNPINDPRSCFTWSGIGQAAESAGARVLLPREQYFRPLTLPGGQLIRNWPVLLFPFDGMNKLIGMAPLKDHHRSGASMVMKNWYGLLGGRRNIFHQDIHNIIKELAMMVRPTLVILDGTTVMMSNGPTGGSLSDLQTMDTLVVGTDQVAVDAFGAQLLGRRVEDLPFIGKAAGAGVGTADFESLRPVRSRLG